MLASASPAPSLAPAQVRAATLLPSPPLARGEGVRLVGLTKALRPMQRASVVTNAASALTIPCAEVPRRALQGALHAGARAGGGRAP
jgi:hypothetical protein